MLRALFKQFADAKNFPRARWWILPLVRMAEALPDQPPDVLLTDLRLPDIDGREIIRRLRAQGATTV